MAKKGKKVRYELDSGEVESLSSEEIKTVLRGADELIMRGGRALLSKILAGSKDKKLLELGLDGSPVYGAFKGSTQKDILAKIDWMIINHYLAIEYDYRTPLLVFTKKGWEIEKETFANELLEQFIEAAKNSYFEFVEELKDRNRELIFLLLDKIAESKNKELILILKAWKEIEYKKVKTKIQEVIEKLDNDQNTKKITRKDVEIISFVARKKWMSIPTEFRKKIERNVWCSSCSEVVQIIDYSVKESGEEIVLHGSCKICGHKVVRVVD